MHDESNHPMVRFLAPSPAAPAEEPATDSQLIERFTTHRDETAFAALVHRHGALVWRVCRTVLRECHAAEDAFQATFLILVRKAGSLRSPELLGNWLYGVAHRVARRARKTRARQEAHERQGVEMLAAVAAEEPAGPDLQPLLQEELQHLPAKYRTPMVLCYLEGHTNQEAARQLQWPVGTVKVRLLRGREMLRTRLVRRGLVLSVGALVTALAPPAAAAAPAALVDTTIRAALAFAAGSATGAGVLSAPAVALAQGVLRSMSWAKLVTAVAVLLALGFLTTGGAWLAFRAHAAPEAVRDTAVARGPAAPVEGLREVSLPAELGRLQGSWNLTAIEVEGQKQPENGFKGSRMVLEGTTLTFFTAQGERACEGTVNVNAASTPKTLDLLFTEGPSKGHLSLGIYELEGDTWKICLNAPGYRVRPREFATRAGGPSMVETLKRAAP
jgi:RNA polymerase sigma factor (sigma-70 family)